MWSSEAVRRRSLLISATVLPLAGCGFQLRQPPRLAFSSIALTGFAPRSPLAAELREQLGRQVRVLESPDKADVVLHALEDQRDRSAVASTATAEVRELQLGVKIKFRARAPGGRELIPVTELAAGRSMSYRETAALAKEFEQAELYREMQTDVVAQVMRRLAAIGL